MLDLSRFRGEETGMCGRYVMSLSLVQLEALFGKLDRLNFPPSWNAAPTQALPIIRLGRQQDFRLTFHFLAAGSSLAACICLPDWPCWNRHPVAWLEVEVPTEEEKKKGKKADKPKKAKAS